MGSSRTAGVKWQNGDRGLRCVRFLSSARNTWPAARSQSADAKALSKKTPDCETVHRFRGLLDHLATLNLNTIQPTGNLPTFDRLTVPTSLQQKAFDLLGVPIPV